MKFCFKVVVVRPWTGRPSLSMNKPRLYRDTRCDVVAGEGLPYYVVFLTKEELESFLKDSTAFYTYLMKCLHFLFPICQSFRLRNYQVTLFFYII